MPIERFIADLQAFAIAALVDIRRFPGSRHNPQYGMLALAQSLHDAGLEYDHEPRLGGRRRTEGISPNVGLHNEAFRAYADYMMTPLFHEALSERLGQASRRATAIMCSESVWWRCHRRLVADAAVLLHDTPVTHIVSGKPQRHIVTAAARVVDGNIVYDLP